MEPGTIAAPSPLDTRLTTVCIWIASWATLNEMPARAASPVTISYKPGAMSRGTMTNGSPASALRQGGDEALALHHDMLEVLGAGHRRQQQAEVELARGQHRGLLRRQHFTQRERDAGARRLERLQQRGQHAIVGERDEADAQPPLLAARHAA